MSSHNIGPNIPYLAATLCAPSTLLKSAIDRSPRRTLPLCNPTDLENRIEAARYICTTARTRGEKLAAFRLMQALHVQRSDATIERMERERGLR